MQRQHAHATGLNRRTAVAAAALTCGYALLALLGLRWGADAGVASPVLPTTGVALAGLLLWGVRLWPAVFAGMMVALLTGAKLPPWATILLAAGNALVAAGGALVLRRAGFDPRLSRLRDMIALTAFAVAAPTMTASASLAAMVFAHDGAPGKVGVYWLSSWAAEASGVLLVVPLLLAWTREAPVAGRRRFWMHVVLTGSIEAALAWLLLGPRAAVMPLGWIVFPPLVWSALAVGVRGTTLSLWPLTAVALCAASSEKGVLAARLSLALEIRLLVVQLFLTVAAATTLMLAAATEERRRGADAMRASEQRLALALETGQLGFWDWNVPSGQASFGGSWAAQLGYDTSELDPHFRSWETRLHPDDAERVTRALNDHLEGRTELYECAHRLRHKDGSWRWILTRGRVVERDAVGRPLRAIGTHADITAFKEAEQRKDEFLATLAHELRNPLAPISNGVAILRRCQSPETVERIVTMMDRQLSHLVALVDDLLDVSRLSRGKIPLRKERVPVEQVVNAAIEACRPAIDAKSHTLHVALPDEPLAVYGDRIRLVQILSNLLTNAAKYTEPGGHITLTVEREGEMVLLRVADSGVGIPPELLPTIWDMFTQVRDTLDKSQGGLGIGLTLVRRLVTMHGGTVSVASDGLGHGSTFTVRLPLLACQNA